MPTKHIQALEALKKKQSAFQEKEEKIKGEILKELSASLVEAHALDVDFDILMGGILDVIKKAKLNDNITEEWKLSGQKFCQQRSKRKNKKTPPKTKNPSQT